MEHICPVCKTLGCKSQLVEIFSGSSSLGATNNYYDESGSSHWHNPNMTIWVYRCSLGHESKRINYNSCSANGCHFSTGESKFLPVADFMKDITT